MMIADYQHQGLVSVLNTGRWILTFWTRDMVLDWFDDGWHGLLLIGWLER
jgi:hypothetical protein